MQPPTAASLLNQLPPAQYNQQPVANPLLQALMNQSAQPVPQIAQPPMQQAAVPNANTNQLANQIAQLLQGRGGIEANALNALIKPDTDVSQNASKPNPNGAAYSTAYPTSSTYDMYYNQSNTNNSNFGGPSKDGDKRYRPY